MSVKPLAERKYEFFLSHAHVDKPRAVEAFYDWCISADIAPFYDKHNLAGHIGPRIAEDVANSMAGVGFLSTSSINSEPCKKEWDLFAQEDFSHPDFQIIGFNLDLEDADVPKIFRDRYYIDLREAGLNGDTLSKFIELMYAPSLHSHDWNAKPVYMARGSKPLEVARADRVRASLRAEGLRVVRDDPRNDRPGRRRHEDMLVRTLRIMRSAYGVVALIPDRGGKTSPYILMEVLQAIQEELPLMLLIDEGLTDEILAAELMGFVSEHAASEPHANKLLETANRIQRSIQTEGISVFGKNVCRLNWSESEEDLRGYSEAFLNDVLERPKRVAKCFMGHRYGGVTDRAYNNARKSIEAVAGMPCKTGDDFRVASAQSAGQVERITEEIRSSTFAIFDIADAQGQPTVNSCIEAGIAMGAGVPYYLVAPGRQRESKPDPTFMLGGVPIHYYESEADLLAKVHQISINYRTISE